MVGLQPSNTGSGKAREALVQQDASPFNANDYDTKDPYLGHATSKDASSEPSSISSYRTGPRYQYFGLGDTQTQEGGIESNSQKENTPAFDKEPHTPPQPTSPNGAQGQSDFRAVPLLPPPSRPTSRANSNPTHRNLSSAPYNPGPLSNSARNLSPTKPTLFAPSRSSVQRDKSSSKRTTPPRFRSSSPDSFVHPAPFEDPRQAFVPPNPVLNEPLSEWFRGDTQETNAERPPVSHESSLAVMEQLSPRDEGGPSRGSVLVDATPSNSRHSQPHDRRSAEDTVPQDNAEDPHAQDTDYSLDLSQGWTPPDVPTAGSSPGTQELVPTQIVPPDDVDMDLYAEPVQEPVVTQSAGSSRPSNRNPRSLLNPNKPWRAEALARFLPPPSEPRAALGIHTQDDDSLYAPTQVISSPDGLPQPANFDDRTQPNISNQEATQVIAPSDGCTQVTAPTIAKPKKTAFQNAEDLFRYRQQHANFGTADATRATSISRPPTGDSDGQGRYMDVVPDSEPGRTQATPGPSRSVDDDSDEDIDNPFKSLPPLPSPVKALSSAPKIDDDDDDEDDVPLASVRHRRSRSPPRKRQRPRGSSMDEAVPFPTKHEATTKTPSPPALSKGKQPMSTTTKFATARKGKATREPAPASSEPTEIPSSVPLQDHGPTAVFSSRGPDPRSKALTRERKKTPRSTSASSTRGRVVTPAFGSPLSPPPDDESIAPETQDPLDLLSHSKEDEETTEPADEPMDLDEDVKPSARKRKRSGPKASTRAGVKNAKVPSLTPSTKTNVRLKGQTSTARSVTVESVRVFAVWKAEARFFSGTVKSLGSKANHFLIAFDDETEAEVGIHQMRRCELRVGDEVVLIEGGKRAAVINVDQFMEEGSVRVEMVDSKSVLEVKPSAVKISSRSILAQWKDRTLAVGDIVPTRSSKPLQVTPSPSRTSTHSSSKPLARMGFVFTTSATGVKREREEEKMKHALTSNGGVLLGDWKEIYHVQGKQDSKRWIITPDDIQYKQNKRIDQVFLLADDANQKPKYLKALALGIPCLEIAWLYTSHVVGDGLDWKSSLLAAGFSDRLNACVSQLVDLDWGSSPSHLSDVMANTVAPKIFTGKSILLVGLEYFPLGKGRKNAGQSSDNNDASREVPSIILFMGAERVETVKDADHASASFEEYDYIVMKDVDDNAEGEGNPKEKGMHVSVEWVKDCLISGRILRTP